MGRGRVGALAASRSRMRLRASSSNSLSFSPALSFTGIALTIVLVTLVGVTSSFNVLTRKPLEFCERSKGHRRDQMARR